MADNGGSDPEHRAFNVSASICGVYLNETLNPDIVLGVFEIARQNIDRLPASRPHDGGGILPGA